MALVKCLAFPVLYYNRERSLAFRAALKLFRLQLKMSRFAVKFLAFEIIFFSHNIFIPISKQNWINVSSR